MIALVRRLVDEAAAAGGSVHPLLGNHEVIALGTRLFGGTEVVHRGVVRTFESIWARNGGLASDQDGIDAELFAWLAGLPAVGLDGDHLLMHSDTLAYLDWGDSVDDDQPTGARDRSPGTTRSRGSTCWSASAGATSTPGRPVPRPRGRSSTRSAGSASSTATASSATSSACPVDSYSEPRLYADGLALDIDGGIYEGGPCLVARLSG